MAPQPLMPAAQYLRMSAEHQRYSLDNQARAIAAYADSNGLEVVRSYVDAGISGLELEPRDGLKQLLADVIGGAAPFEVVLVFDVSRWGRYGAFQAENPLGAAWVKAVAPKLVVACSGEPREIAGK